MIKRMLIVCIIAGFNSPAFAADIKQQWQKEFYKQLPKYGVIAYDDFIKKFESISSYKEYMQRIRYGNIDGEYRFGQGVCDSLDQGRKELDIRLNYYHFWGKEVSDAMYFASTKVLCPQYRK